LPCQADARSGASPAAYVVDGDYERGFGFPAQVRDLSPR
jgi:hypothetical protein